MTDLKNNYMIRRQQIIQPSGDQTIKKDIPVKGSGQSFEEILKKVEDGQEVKFSKHATQRLEERSIKLNETELKKITEAVDKASRKGIKDALILMDDKIFVANIKNRTIVTASDEKNLKDNVFTNIDGAVIV